MSPRHRRGTALLTELVASLASGAVLALTVQLLASAVPVLSGPLPAWVLVAVTPTAALLGFFIARHRYRRTEQAFVLISARTHTRWLGDLLEGVSRSLDRHGVDLVVKLPPHDHSGRGQLLHLASLRRNRRTFVGGLVTLVVPEQLERTPRELVELCEEIDRPVVFVDVRPFPDTGAYPARTAFVGCDPEEIGERAAQWAFRELKELGVDAPTVLVVGGEAQVGRHTRFEARLRHLMPAARVEVNLLGLFARDRAREIVNHHLRDLQRRGETLDAIFCTNDEMALGAADAVQEHLTAGHRTDGPVIIGVDGIAEAVALIKSEASPLRATIVQDTRRIADVAVDVLLRMRAGERVPTETFVPTTLYPM